MVTACRQANAIVVLSHAVSMPQVAHTQGLTCVDRADPWPIMEFKVERVID